MAIFAGEFFLINSFITFMFTETDIDTKAFEESIDTRTNTCSYYTMLLSSDYICEYKLVELGA